jgi:hypothetical protein
VLGTHFDVTASQLNVTEVWATTVVEAALMFPLAFQTHAASQITVNWQPPTAVASQPTGVVIVCTVVVPVK